MNSVSLLPRERCIQLGVESLSDEELLSVVLGSGTQKVNVFELSANITSTYPLAHLKECSLEEIKSFDGIGISKAVLLKSVFELGKRAHTKSVKSHVHNASEAFSLMIEHFYGLDYEVFYALFLNQANGVLACELISSGGVSSTQVDPKILFSKALRCRACKIIIAHNHPSGQLRASPSDIKLTKNLNQSAKLLGMELLDHLIIADDQFVTV